MYGGGGHYDGGSGAANANSLFGGGGFMPSQSTYTPENSSSSLSKARSAQSLLPLTVKQIMDASQSNDDKSNFVVDGTEVSTVRLVGRMLNKIERVTDVSFILDDGTGRIDVNRWENESTDTKEMADVENGDYVVVNGGLKGFQGKRHVVAYSVRPVINFNDITHHFLHCIYVHLELTRSKPQVNASSATVTPNQAMHRNDMTRNQVPLPNNQAPTFSASRNSTGTDMVKLVMDVFHDPTLIDRELGVSYDDVKSRINISDELLRTIISDQVDHGHLYATIDDNHHKSTMNG